MSSKPLPTSHSDKMYLLGKVYADQPGEVFMHFTPYRPSDDAENFIIEEFTLERSIDWGGVDPTQRQVAQLLKAIQSTRAEAARQVNEHQATINKLLAIEGGK